LRETARNPENYRQKPSDFTRTRKLPFKTLCKFLAKLAKKSLQSELNCLFGQGKTCTKSALCQARKKLKPAIFKDLFDASVQSFYQHHKKAERFKSYRLWACDCTVQMLPDTEENRKIGLHKNQYKSVAPIKLSCYFDILNKLVTSVSLHPKQTTDISACLQKQVQEIPKDVIAIYDRGYASHIVPFWHGLKGSKYVIRLKLEGSNTVKQFMESPDNEAFITEPLSERAYKKLEEFGIRKSKMDTISHRLVKVILPTGETKVLMTNLDNSFTISGLSELYRLRWAIETCFFCLKGHQMLGIFSGYPEQVILQDIWVNLLFYNIQTITNLDATLRAKQISQKRNNKPPKNKKKRKCRLSGQPKYWGGHTTKLLV
jgi:Transposase DDE domain